MLAHLTALDTIAEQCRAAMAQFKALPEPLTDHQRHAFVAEADRLTFEWESAAVSLPFLLGLAVERARCGAQMLLKDA